jgi:glycosyltransferase involved in cell wall biosynthesis
MNQYPATSHTFVRRELRQIERLGHSVLRLTIRESPHGLVEPQDLEERARTITCLGQPLWRLLGAMARVCVTRPAGVVRAARKAWAMHRRSDRGLITHAAYLIEAAFLLGVLRRERVQHVHVHFGSNAAAVMRLVRALGGPTYSVTFHGSAEWDEASQLDIGGKVVDALFVTAISSFASAQVRRWTPLEHWHKIHVVRCTVGEAYMIGAPPPAPDCQTLVIVARLGPEKGTGLLIEAFASAVSRLGPGASRARLVLVGEGPMRAGIERRAAELEIADRIEITGWQPEEGVRRRLLDSRVFILPSFAEGLPVVIMEAFALGRPVIATYVGAVPELVVPGENGWLVPAGDTEATTRAIMDALTAPQQKIESMARAGQAAVRERHNTATEAARLDELFRRYAGGVG